MLHKCPRGKITKSRFFQRASLAKSDYLPTEIHGQIEAFEQAKNHGAN